MIRKAFLLRIFDAANMQRWNDQIRPVELTELDKQAHKMIIAYVLGKYEEETNPQHLDWTKIIEGGIFEFLQRLVVTDLKPQLFDKIRQDPNKYQELNRWAYKQIEPDISALDPEFCARFKDYLLNPRGDLTRRILKAAHSYATKWEFNIVERANPNGYEIQEIKNKLRREEEKSCDLEGIRQLVLDSGIRQFVDLCGNLRFQLRWSHLYRIPKTSVLGHMLIVAMLAYLFSIEINACKKRSVNNYFAGLFHDLPEVLTRDIINPVKRSIQGLEELIEKFEKDELARTIYRLIPKKWHSEMKLFAEDEFTSTISKDGKREIRSSDAITSTFDSNRYDPKDGEIVKAVDDLSAFVEAYLTVKYGIRSPEFQKARDALKKKYETKNVAGIRFSEIYADFE